MSQSSASVPGGRVLVIAVLQALLILAITAGLVQLFVFPLFQDKVMSPLQRWEVEYLAGGTIELLENELSSTSEAGRASYLDGVAKDFGFAVYLLSPEQLDLDQSNLERLRRDEVVGDPHTYTAFKLLDNGNQVLVFDRIRVPAEHLLTEAQRRHMGTVATLERMLRERPEETWNVAIQNAAALYEYPIALSSVASLELSDKQMAALLDDRIVSVETDDSITADYPAEMVYKKIGNSVLALGPFSPPTLKRYYPAITGYYVVLASIVLLPLLIWLVPTWRSLNQLSRTANAFGQGCFAARAARVRGSQLNYLIGVFNNMAAKIQSLIESNKALVNAVSHELRTPISRIEFNIELARQSTDIEERNANLDRIEESIDELNSMVSEMLQFARFDREKPNFSLQSVMIDEWLSSEKKNWYTREDAAKIRLDVPDRPEQVILERYYMSRAISNLVRNATRFAETTIVVKARREKDMFEISVEDDGPGVDYSERTRIFEPFVRQDQSRSRDSGGTGLGLAIVKQIVAWHSGEVWVQDSELGGAKFIIRWPQSTEAESR